jgi:hypothetical protein
VLSGRSTTQQGRNITQAMLNYSNPGKELWPGHVAFRGARAAGERAFASGGPSNARGLPTNTAWRMAKAGGGEK